MPALKASLEGSLHYRGHHGQLSFLLHRISGLGTLLFLTVHILDTATVYFFPGLYEHAIAIYRSTPFMLGEIVLVFLVIYHGANGLRIALFDLHPQLWRAETQQRAAVWVFALSVVLWLPAAYWMGRSLVVHNFLGG
ncbi:MAG: succinate dehydrogenase, cytochrome b556 subunit [Chloroflexota bacterium]